MKKLYLVLYIVLLVGALILTSCSATTSTTSTVVTNSSSTTSTQAGWEWPSEIYFITHPSTASGYVATAAWTPVLSQTTGMQVRLTPMESATNRWKLFVQDVKYDIATMMPTDASVLIEAQGLYADPAYKPSVMRVLYRIMDIGTAPCVRGDSEIQNLSDIRAGIRFAYDASNPFGIPLSQAEVRWAGLNIDDVEWIPAAGQEQLCQMILDGKADIGHLALNSPVIVQAEASTYGIRALEMDPAKEPEAAQRFWEVCPNYTFGKNPSGLQSSIGKYCPVITYVYVVRDDLDTELVYNLVKWLDENFNAFKDKDFRVSDMSLTPFVDTVRTLYLPVHDGVKQYLIDKGLWTDKHESTLQSNLNLMALYEQALNDAVIEALSQGINVNPDNETWTEFWGNYKIEHNIPRVKPWN